MLLVNDPNAALVGSLRPRPENPLIAALREGLAGPSLEEPALRSRAPFWVAGGLLAAVIVLVGAVAHELSAGAAARVAAEPVSAPARAGSTVLASDLTPHTPPAPIAPPVAPAVTPPIATALTTASVAAPRATAKATAKAPARARLQRTGKSAKKAGGPRAHKNSLAPSRVAAR
jgi:hypothetical protein